LIFGWRWGGFADFSAALAGRVNIPNLELLGNFSKLDFQKWMILISGISGSSTWFRVSGTPGDLQKNKTISFLSPENRFGKFIFQ